MWSTFVKKCIWLLIIAGSPAIYAQIDAGLFRFPDVSADHIVFTYANDLWLMPKEGGTAQKLSSPKGIESFPKFSSDGKMIAFSGNYDGNNEVYVIPTQGGAPVRLTYHSYFDRVVDWHPDGKQILFASGRESEKERFNQFYTIHHTGGSASKLPLAYAEFGTYSPNGDKMALVFRSTIFSTWKRYRGGDVADIYIYDFKEKKSQNISSNIDAGEEFPMWHNESIYFLSDNGPEKRMNLWKYDLKTQSRVQLTFYKSYDVHHPSIGPSEIVFEAEGNLHLLSLKDHKIRDIKVNLINDQNLVRPSYESAEKFIAHTTISPDGNRVLVEARGEIFTLPAENGYVKNLTRSSSAAERYPAWSPDGKSIAYWSDATGEYELYLKNLDEFVEPIKLTSLGKGFRYQIFWSPDSKKLAFIDKAMQIMIFDVEKKSMLLVDKALSWAHWPLESFIPSWSSDSKYLAYFRDLENSHNAIFIYDLPNKKTNQVTSGYYDCSYPSFDPEGKYLYLLTNQSFEPIYSDHDNTFVYPNSTQLAAISLAKNTPSFLFPKNDTVLIKVDEPKKEVTDSTASSTKEKKKKKIKTEESAVLQIDFEEIERRLFLLPLPAGNYSNPSAANGKLVYIKSPNTGSAKTEKSSLKYFDIESREEKTILEGINSYKLSFDGKKVLVSQQGSWAVLKVEEGQKIDKKLRVNEMETFINPKEEWQQLFMDAWRFERDYFYDENMHGVDWDKVKKQYLKLLESAMSREEVNYILGEMIGELNASHTYRGGGVEESPKRKDVGYLGINWTQDKGYYKIGKIIKAGAQDAEIRSSLDAPGLSIKEGDFILAVNGNPLNTATEPFAYFQGLAGKTIELTYNSKPEWNGAQTVLVQAMSDESRLRHLAWIESNRKRVDEATNGEVGYIYVRSTGTDGQSELIRQFVAQWNKKALIIDERFNNGGQIPDRFIEVLNREPLAFWAIRDGNTWPWPPYANFGPKVMLINGWSGSGGDAFPDYFRKKKLGPLIGARTWGGLIGISGVPSLIDGGGITVPTFRMYNPDGTWFKEGHGVEPDILVEEDLGAMAKGIDPQLEKGIEEIKLLLKSKAFKQPDRPAKEIR